MDAAAIVTSVLQKTEKEEPWWLYLFGEWWHLEARLLDLRKRVQR